MKPPPRIIVVEGLDGSGKSTLVRDLAARLDAISTSTPDPMLASAREHIDSSWDRAARRLFYAASVIHTGSWAANLRAAGRTVVIDRYWSSTVAYSIAEGEVLPLDALAQLVVPADVTIYLEVDDGTRRARLEQRGATSEDLRTIAPARSEQLRAAYDEALRGAWNGAVRRVDVRGATLELCEL